MAKLPYIERDVSWLYFNERVLQEAKDPNVPLYERLKFLAIYSSNLDEFFRVRVASLRSFKELKKKMRKQLEVKPKKALKQIHKIVDNQQKEFGRIFREEIKPQLANNQIHLLKSDEFNPTQRSFALQYFQKQIFPNVKPVFLINDEQVAPFLKNKELYFIVHFESEEAPLALIEIPTDTHKRFFQLPVSPEGGHYLTFLDDVVRIGLADFFKGLTIKGAHAIKISRDADIYIENEYSGDLVEKIRQGLEERDIGLPTRFLYDQSMPNEILDKVTQRLKLSKNDLIPGGRYHNFNDFFGFPDPTNNPALHYQSLTPLVHRALEKEKSMLSAIAKKDYMLHFPYQKYDYVSQLIEEAAEDPDVECIRITLYRVAAQSEVVNSLLKALKNGKKVTAFIEVKARFDERSNLTQGAALKAAGAEVRYSFPGVKVHTKLLLIHRRENNEIKHYAYLGTGNFNEKTARIYCDHALLTTDQRLGDEVEQVFQILLGNIILPKCEHLLVSPYTTRKGFNKRINREIANAKEGKDAWIFLKMNSLEDRRMIEKLYEASQAGVKIQLIVRGICCLVPGVKGVSENIEIISIVDRFLEHARVYVFANGGKPKMYTASADWMTRNLDRRVEVVMPIYDKAIFKEVWDILQLQWQDNVKARLIDENQENKYQKVDKKIQPIRAQMDIYEYLKEKS